MNERALVVIAALAVGVGALAIVLIRFVTKLNAERKEHASFAERFSAVTDLEAEAEHVKQRLQSQKVEFEGDIDTFKMNLQREINRHESIVAEEQARRTKLTNQYQGALQKYKQLTTEIAHKPLLRRQNSRREEDVSFGLYQPHFTFDTSEDYKDAIKECRGRQRTLIREGGAVQTPGNWTVEGSREKGRKMERQYPIQSPTGRATRPKVRASRSMCAAASGPRSIKRAVCASLRSSTVPHITVVTPGV